MAGIGGERHAHGSERLLDQLLQPVGGGIGGHGGGAEGIDRGLQRGGGDSDQSPLKRQGKAQAQCALRDLPVKGQVAFFQPEIGVPAECIHQGAEAGQKLGQHGRESRAENAHPEGADEQQVQPHIQHAGNHQEVERGAGIPQRPLHGGCIVVDGDQRH